MLRLTRLASIAALVFLASCSTPGTMGSDGGPTMDSAIDSGAHGACATDTDCDDGSYCNGPEHCMPHATGADARGCVAGSAPCPDAMHCSETTSACLTDCDVNPDADGDHVRSIACGGTDCDDHDPTRFPGNPEVCDTLAHDEDCDPMTYGFRDADGDGVADARCCNLDAMGTSICGTDCNDMAPGTHPTAAEVCDGMDQDCDGAIDEGVLRTFYPDADGDHFGARGSTPILACNPPPNTIEGDDTDCNDMVATIQPSAVDACTPAGTDEDCDGAVDEGCGCTGTSRACPGALGACAAGTQNCTSGTWAACSIQPVDETCNMVDDDCDGSVDEGVGVFCYLDNDNDGLGVPGSGTTVCAATGGGCPPGTTANVPTTMAFDCDDTTPTSIGSYFFCYTDGDGDGYAGAGPAAAVVCMAASAACPTGTVMSSTPVDCNDASAAVSPGTAEICNGIDDNCNGTIDECASMLHQVYTCMAGSCQPAGCLPGYGDCNGMTSDGCETNLGLATSCGTCGTVCADTDDCCGGTCVPLGTNAHCGSCAACGTTSYCCNGACIPGGHACM